jgi:hypothetical protein
MRRLALNAVCLMLVWGGCQSWTPQRGVDARNNFYSTRYPEITVSIDPDLAYIGHLEHSKYQRYKNDPGGSTSHFETFLFGTKDADSRLRRGVIIRTKKLSEGYILPDLFDKVKHRLDAGITSFGDQNYQYAVFPAKRPFFDFEETYLFEQGYVLSDRFLAKAFSRRDGSDNNYSILIMYVESLENFQRGKTRFRDWTDREYLSDAQKEFLDTMGRTCDRCLLVSPGVPEQ